MTSFLVIILNSLPQEVSQGGFHICRRHGFDLGMLHGANRDRNCRNSRNCIGRERSSRCVSVWAMSGSVCRGKIPSWLVICLVYIRGIKYYYRLSSGSVIQVSKRSLWPLWPAIVKSMEHAMVPHNCQPVLGRMQEDSYEFHTSLGQPGVTE